MRRLCHHHRASHLRRRQLPVGQNRSNDKIWRPTTATREPPMAILNQGAPPCCRKRGPPPHLFMTSTPMPNTLMPPAAARNRPGDEAQARPPSPAASAAGEVSGRGRPEVAATTAAGRPNPHPLLNLLGCSHARSLPRRHRPRSGLSPAAFSGDGDGKGWRGVAALVLAARVYPCRPRGATWGASEPMNR
jgi:hypothetical protein